VLSFKEGKPLSSISFLLENKGSKLRLQAFVISTDSLENISKINFNHNLNLSLQDSLEIHVDTSQWSWR
jgi:hypothetical protein